GGVRKFVCRGAPVFWWAAGGGERLRREGAVPCRGDLGPRRGRTAEDPCAGRRVRCPDLGSGGRGRTARRGAGVPVVPVARPIRVRAGADTWVARSGRRA